MDKKEKRTDLEKVLNRFTFVKWDRVIPFSIGIDVYGWIDKEGSAYKDFVLLSLWENVNEGEPSWNIHECFTSSAKYSLEVNRLSGFTNSQHTDCIKVPDYLSKLTN